MFIDQSLLTEEERIILALRRLYLGKGYKSYHMGKFEEYDLYAENKEFLVSENVITFTDTGGKLMALKPDVTLSIIKNCTVDKFSMKGYAEKLFYNEHVYRVSQSNGHFTEIMQSGVECFGDISIDDICEVAELALESMPVISENCELAVSDISIIEDLLSALGLRNRNFSAAMKAIGEKNLHELESLISADADKSQLSLLEELVTLRCNITDSSELFDTHADFFAAYPEFIAAVKKLAQCDTAGHIYLDFSVTADANYYNGIVFKGYINGIPTPVLSGGQYDRLMQRLHKNADAIGFAVYLDTMNQYAPAENAAKADEFINVALPKGRLGEKVCRLFEKSGYDCSELLDDKSRKLIFTVGNFRFFWVNPADVPIYVERGVADVGVAGKDILLEYAPEVYELLDLNMGKCRMAVAAPVGYRDNPGRVLRVATKFSNIARSYYNSKDRDIDIIHLNGSIEIAPLLGLSDVIVDIVETGTTLKENNLEVIETVVPISARFIANKTSYRFKYERIEKLAKELESVL